MAAAQPAASGPVRSLLDGHARHVRRHDLAGARHGSVMGEDAGHGGKLLLVGQQARILGSDPLPGRTAPICCCAFRPSGVKTLHAKVGELTSVKRFSGRRARPGRPSERKAMVGWRHDLSASRQAKEIGISRIVSDNADCETLRPARARQEACPARHRDFGQGRSAWAEASGAINSSALPSCAFRPALARGLVLSLSV